MEAMILASYILKLPPKPIEAEVVDMKHREEVDFASARSTLISLAASLAGFVAFLVALDFFA